MSALSDVDILHAIQRNELSIEPFDKALVQPASVDLRLGNEFVTLATDRIVDLKTRELESYAFYAGDDEGWDLLPGKFVLGTTLEAVMVSPALRGRVEGKSSPGRLGLIVHTTAGFIDPGFSGQITLEFYNVSQNTLRLRPGLPICQISFDRLITSAAQPYGTPGLGSRYQGQRGATPAKS